MQDGYISLLVIADADAPPTSRSECPELHDAGRTAICTRPRTAAAAAAIKHARPTTTSSFSELPTDTQLHPQVRRHLCPRLWPRGRLARPRAALDPRPARRLQGGARVMADRVASTTVISKGA